MTDLMDRAMTLRFLCCWCGYRTSLWNGWSIVEKLDNYSVDPEDLNRRVTANDPTYRDLAGRPIYCSESCAELGRASKTRARKGMRPWKARRLRKAKKQLRAAASFLRTQDPSHLDPWRSPSAESTATKTSRSA